MNFKVPIVTKSLIILMVVIHLISIIFNLDLCIQFGLYGTFTEDFKWFQAITSLFIHNLYDPLHIVGNLLVLFLVGPFLEKKLGTKNYILSMVMAGIVSLCFAQYHQHTKYMSSSKYLMEEGIDPYDYQEENLTFDQQTQVENYLYSVGNTKGFSGIIFSMAIMYLLFNFLEIRKILINLFIGYVLFEMISTVFFTDPEFSHYIGSGDYAHLGGFISGILFLIWHKKTHI